MGWLLGSHLVDQVTPPEWQFVMGARGDHRSFVLHHDAVFALAWLLGLSRHLDPTAPPEDQLMRQMPHLPDGETFAAWRSRTLVAPRDPVEAAVLLDLYYCLDWSFQEAERTGCGRRVRSTATRSGSGGGRWSGRWSSRARTTSARQAGKRSTSPSDRRDRPLRDLGVVVGANLHGADKRATTTPRSAGDTSCQQGR